MMVRCWQPWPEARTRGRQRDLSSSLSIRAQFSPRLYGSRGSRREPLFLPHLCRSGARRTGRLHLRENRSARRSAFHPRGNRAGRRFHPGNASFYPGTANGGRTGRDQWPLRHNPRFNPGWRLPWIRDRSTTGARTVLNRLESLSLDGVTTFRDLLRAMSKTAFSGRQLGEAFDVFMQMAGDPSCRVVLTISGAMTVAKQGRIVCDMIDRGLVHAVIATGGAHRPRPDRVDRPDALSARSGTERRGALRPRLQPHLRHARDGVQPQRGGPARGVRAWSRPSRKEASGRRPASAARSASG